MYNIGICDDGINVCDAIKNMILKYGKEKNLILETSIYYSGEELCADLEQGKYLDILFLDIELLEMTGIQVGNYIRNRLENRSIQIVYISGKQGYTQQLFKVQPLDFLVKPIEVEQVYEVLELADKILRKNQQTFEYWQGHECFRVPFSEIIGFFSEGRKLRIYTIRDSREYYGKLKEVIADLPENFYVIHQSYVVNDDYVVRYAYEEVELTTGEILTISKQYRKKVRQKIIQRKRNRLC